MLAFHRLEQVSSRSEGFTGDWKFLMVGSGIFATDMPIRKTKRNMEGNIWNNYLNLLEHCID